MNSEPQLKTSNQCIASTKDGNQCKNRSKIDGRCLMHTRALDKLSPDKKFIEEMRAKDPLVFSFKKQVVHHINMRVELTHKADSNQIQTVSKFPLTPKSGEYKQLTRALIEISQKSHMKDKDIQATKEQLRIDKKKYKCPGPPGRNCISNTDGIVDKLDVSHIGPETRLNSVKYILKKNGIVDDNTARQGNDISIFFKCVNEINLYHHSNLYYCICCPKCNTYCEYYPTTLQMKLG